MESQNVQNLSAEELSDDHDEEIIKSSNGGGVDISTDKEKYLSEEEWAELTTLLLEAYPATEKGKLTQNVLAQIRTEKVRKQKYRTWFRRYGSIAACLVLLGGALLLTYPHWNQMEGWVWGDEEVEAATASSPMYDTIEKAEATSGNAETTSSEATFGEANSGANSGEENSNTSSFMAFTSGNAETVAETTAETTEDTNSGANSETPSVYSDQAAGFAIPQTNTQSKATEEVKEAAEEPEVEKVEVEVENEEGVQTYSATFLLKSVSMFAAIENSITEDAAEDSSIADAFLQYILTEGYLTHDEYQVWLNERGRETAWEPTELCEAFGLDMTLYDEWLHEQG